MASGVLTGCTNPLVPGADGGPMRIDVGPTPDSGAIDAWASPDAFTAPDTAVPDDAFAGTDAACDSGTISVGGICMPIPAPRQIAPLSTSRATSRRPTLRWVLSAPATGALVEICSDRACAMPLEQTIDVPSGTSAVPTADLAPGVHFWRLHGRAGAATGTAVSVVWEMFVPWRTASHDSSWGSVLDLNGDGRADVAVGAPGAVGTPGMVHIYYSAAGALPASPDVNLVGPGGANGSFGYTVGSAGDVNGDGIADLLVGAQNALGQGRVYVYFGHEAAHLASAPDVTLSSTTTAFGERVSGVGDVNGDGYADIAAGHGGGVGGIALVEVFHGASTGPSAVSASLPGPAGAGGSFGFELSGGDVDADGFSDILVSGSEDMTTGRVYYYRGAAGGVATSPSVTINSPAAGSHFGASVVFAGDLNGDGYGDVAVGSPPPTPGAVYYFLGGGAGIPASPSGQLTVPSGTGGGFGERLVAAGDTNGDGYDDLWVGNYLYPAGGADRQGQGYVYFGTTSGTSPTASVTFSNTDGFNANFASSAAAGDVDGDHYDDVGIGSLVGDPGVGRVHVFRGGVGVSTTDSWTLNGTDGAGQGFGGSMAM